MDRIILCSASPRRRELLNKLIPHFDTMKSDAEEVSPYLRPHTRVMDLARKKAEILSPREGELLISADTLVYRKGRYYGKPEDYDDAFRMLRELSGRTHTVYTGVCLRSKAGEISFYDRSEVLFMDLSDEMIDRYLREFAPFDKAGAYGIQDGVVVKSYLGSFDNIMGLPTEKLREALVEMGVKNVY